jgi:Arm DNA-binding domain
MKLHLTERTITKLPAPDPSGRQTLYWDSDHKNALAGFAVLCSGATHSKTYIVQRTLPGGRNRRVTVGAVNGLSLEKARELAADILHQLRHGHDPKKKIDNPKRDDETYAKAFTRKYENDLEFRKSWAAVTEAKHLDINLKMAKGMATLTPTSVEVGNTNVSDDSAEAVRLLREMAEKNGRAFEVEFADPANKELAMRTYTAAHRPTGPSVNTDYLQR